MIRLHPSHWTYRIRSLLSNPILWGFAGLIAVATLIAVLLQTRQEFVTVTETVWVQEVEVEKYALRPDDGFTPPNDALEVKDLGQRIHHYDRVFSHYTTEYYNEQVACGQTCGGSGAQRSCHTRYCTRPRSRQVAVYRNVPVYRPYYSWKAWRWAKDREKTFREVNSPWRVIDPLEFEFQIGLNPGENERFTIESEYEVTFSNLEKDTWSFSPEDKRTFAQYPVGYQMTLEVNGFGSIISDLDLK